MGSHFSFWGSWQKASTPKEVKPSAKLSWSASDKKKKHSSKTIATAYKEVYEPRHRIYSEGEMYNTPYYGYSYPSAPYTGYRYSSYHNSYVNNYYSYTVVSADTLEKFVKVYKHLDDLKSILGVPNKISLKFCRGYTYANSDDIYVKTDMFDTITDYDEALNVCMGGALLDIARWYISPLYRQGTELRCEQYYQDLKATNLYIDCILQKSPGYFGLVESYIKYREEKSKIFKCRNEEYFTLNWFKDHVSYVDMETYQGTVSNFIKDDDTIRQIEGSLIIEDSIRTHIAENHEIRYKNELNYISEYIPMVSNSLNQFFVNSEVRYYGGRTGILDSNKLVEAIQGAPNVYYNKFQRKTSQLDICILIDESGSMCHDERITMAKRAAILLNEACKRINNCNLYIYGHSGDDKVDLTTDIYCYKDTTVDKPYSLGTIHARAQNRDGEAIRQVCKKVRKQTQNQVLLFVLSDGNPEAHGTYENSNFGIQDTKEAVKEAEKQGFVVTQCTFRGTRVNSKLMFDNYFTIDNYDDSEFAVKFVKYVSGELIRNYKITEN